MATQLEQLLPHAPVLRRQIIAPAQPFARRREALRARVHGARERPESAQRGALEEASGAAAIRLLCGDQEELADQQQDEEQADAARAHGRSGVLDRVDQRIDTLRSRCMSSRTRPVPSTTQASGSSA